MAIAFIDAATASTSASVTSYTGPTPPGGTQTGHLIVLLCGLSSGTPPAISSSGYTAVTGSDLTAGSSRLTWLWKIAGASEAAPTIDHAATAAGACVMLIFSGIDTTTPFDIDCTSTVGGGAVTTVTNSNITTVTDQALPICQGSVRTASGAAGTLTISANYTEGGEVASTTAGANEATAGYYRTSGPVSIGTYGGETFTSTASGRMACVHGALRPAAGGAIDRTVTDTVGVRELVRRTTEQTHDISVLVSP